MDVALVPHFSDAITQLVHDWQWTEVEDSVDDIIASCVDSVESWYSDMLIGSVHIFIVATLPDGWLLLDGATYDKVDYPELWAVLPSQMKTETQFTLFSMENTFPMGVVDADDIDQAGGENTTNLTVAQLAAHTHTYIPPVLTVEAETPTTPIPTAGVGTSTTTGSTGDGDDIENRPSFRGIFFAVFTGRGS